MSSEKLPHLLIVEDDRALQKQIRWAFDQYETLTADDRESALMPAPRNRRVGSKSRGRFHTLPAS